MNNNIQPISYQPAAAHNYHPIENPKHDEHDYMTALKKLDGEVNALALVVTSGQFDMAHFETANEMRRTIKKEIKQLENESHKVHPINQQQFNDDISRLKMNLTTIKITMMQLSGSTKLTTAYLEDKGLVKEQFRAGKAKRVLAYIANVVVEGEKKKIVVGSHVYILPVKGGIFGFIKGLLKKREILTEVKTTAEITNSLSTTSQERTTNKILKFYQTATGDPLPKWKASRYESFEAFVSDFSNPSSKIKDADKLKEFYANPANALIITNLKDDNTHLALDLKVKDKTKKAFSEDNPVVQRRAEDDMEHIARKKELKPQERASIAFQILDAMNNLHRAGKVHGDLKLENLLGFNANVSGRNYMRVGLSDFGKTETLGSDETTVYGGNPRHVSTENRLSQKSEVQSSAFMLIRVLEEPYLNKQGKLENLSSATNEPLQEGAVEMKKRRGIEQALIDNPNCPQNEKVSLLGRIGKVITSGVRNALGISKGEKAEQEIHMYIDNLTAKMAESHPDKQAALLELNKLLKEMTKADPDKRPTMAEAMERFPLELLQL